MKKSRLVLWLSIGFFLAGGILFYATISLEVPYAVQTGGWTALLTAIQKADGLEVCFLGDAEGRPAGRYRTKLFPADFDILSTRRLTSEQAKELLGIFKQHTFETRGGAACHNPGYLLRFFQGSSTILTGSLCLQCNNMEIEPYPFFPMWVSLWETKSKDFHLTQLEEFFAKLGKGT